MQTWVRRRMFDEEKKIISDDGFITSALVVAAGLVQAEVKRVAPDVFRRHYFRNLEQDKYRYQLPRGFIRMKQVFINGVPADPGTERSIELGRYVDARYVVTGGEIVITPKPTTPVEDGLHLLYVPALELSEPDDDMQDQGLVEPLHMAVILRAVKLLQPEGGESNKEIDAEISMLEARIPELYSGYAVNEPLEVEGLPHNIGDNER
jgi:hypothetical protein